LLKLNPPHYTFTRRHLKAARNLRHNLNQIYSTRLGGSRTLLTEKACADSMRLAHHRRRRAAEWEKREKDALRESMRACVI
jgi:hypothetical protein